MPNLIRVQAPHRRNGDTTVRVQWNMGNTCNYACEYCPSILHDGSRPWLPADVCVRAAEQITQHYNQPVHFELIGGEVTVMPGFREVVEAIHRGGARSTIYTNASRSVAWWSQAKEYLDTVQITWHPLTLDFGHLCAVITEIRESVDIAINIAGIHTQVEMLGERADEIRTLFEGSNRNPSDRVSIAVKTMYAKYLGRGARQQTYWAYTEREREVLARPGIPPQPAPQSPSDPDPNDANTSFDYDDGTRVYSQNHQIIDRGLNSFQGMHCYAGIESISIDPGGDIYGSWCGAAHLGNIQGKWSLPNKPIACPFSHCNNLADCGISKVAPGSTL